MPVKSAKIHNVFSHGSVQPVGDIACEVASALGELQVVVAAEIAGVVKIRVAVRLVADGYLFLETVVVSSP